MCFSLSISAQKTAVGFGLQLQNDWDCPEFTFNEYGSFSYDFPPPFPNPGNIDGSWNVEGTLDGNVVFDQTILGFQGFAFDFKAAGMQLGSTVTVNISPNGDFIDCPGYSQTYVVGCPTFNVEFENDELCMNIFYPENDPPFLPLPFSGNAGLKKLPYNTAGTFFFNTTEASVCIPIPGGPQLGNNNCMVLNLLTPFCDYEPFNGTSVMCDQYDYCDIPEFEFDVTSVVSNHESAPGANDGVIEITVTYDSDYTLGDGFTLTEGDNNIIIYPTLSLPPNENSITYVFTGLGAGFYTYQIVNSEYCSEFTSAEVEVECVDESFGDVGGFNCLLNIVMEAVDGTGGNLGSIHLEAYQNPNSPIGSALPSPLYIYWDDMNGSTTSTQRNNLEAGTYCATVYFVDEEEGTCCENKLCATVGEPECPPLNYGVEFDRPCEGVNSGSIEVQPFPYANPYTVAWNTGATGSSIDNLSVGTYEATVTWGSAQCVEVISVTLEESPPFVLQVGSIDATCDEDFENGVAFVEVFSPEEGYYAFEWSNEDGEIRDGQIIDELIPGTYWVVVENSDGCIETASVTIEESDEGYLRDEDTDPCNIIISCNGVVTDVIPKDDYLDTDLLSNAEGENARCYSEGCSEGSPIPPLESNNFTEDHVENTDGSNPCQPCLFLVRCPHDETSLDWIKGFADFTDQFNNVSVVGPAPVGDVCGSCLYNVTCKLLIDVGGTGVEIASFQSVAQKDPGIPIPTISGEPPSNGTLPSCPGFTDDGPTTSINTHVWTTIPTIGVVPTILQEEPCGGLGSIGDACDDADDTTINDVVGSGCVCAGTPDPNYCGTLALFIGDSCDDGDNTTINDAVDANCNCSGTPDPDFCETLGLFIGEPCNDGDNTTINDVVDSNCNCSGDPDPTYCGALSLFIGDACNDGDNTTVNDAVDANCNCTGTPDVNYCASLGLFIGDSCDDGNNTTINDVVNANCNCVGTPDPDYCGSLGQFVGELCDDGDPATYNDVVDADCNCAGFTIYEPPCCGPPEIGDPVNPHNPQVETESNYQRGAGPSKTNGNELKAETNLNFNRVYPNPFTDIIRVEFESGFDQTVKLNLFNKLGQLTRSVQMQVTTGKQTLTLEALNVANGIYFLEIIDEKGNSISRKLSKY